MAVADMLTLREREGYGGSPISIGEAGKMMCCNINKQSLLQFLVFY
jgi:hypothetical protein